ncbi:MAG: PspA/IM30 family protein [Dehalococcoidia bacterium]|nr:PspA/IM30 family protein [Dehalococcoidia bacterium]
MVLKRLKTILEAKANKALDAAEDPREMLDLSYEKQLDMLRDVKRGVVEVTAAKRRLQLQADEQRAQLAKFDGQARQAMVAGREDLARLALERKQSAVTQVADFDAQVAQLQGEQDRLVQAEQRLQAKVDAFRTRKEVVKAQYSAAKATVRINESLTGLSEEMSDVGASIQRAEDKTAQLRAKGDAISELIASGVLDDNLGGGTALDRELDALGSQYSVELELEELRRQLDPAPAPPQLEAPR